MLAATLFHFTVMVASDLAPGERKNSPLLFFEGLAKFILVYRGSWPIAGLILQHRSWCLQCVGLLKNESYKSNDQALANFVDWLAAGWLSTRWLAAGRLVFGPSNSGPSSRGLDVRGWTQGG